MRLSWEELNVRKIASLNGTIDAIIAQRDEARVQLRERDRRIARARKAFAHCGHDAESDTGLAILKALAAPRKAKR